MTRHRWADRRGQATVEVALALPVVVLALLLVVQVALVARSQLLVVHAAREGARAAAVDPAPGVADRAARATPGLRPGSVRTGSTLTGADGGLVEVTVRYRAPTDVPLVGRLLGEPELRATVAMRVEHGSPP
ncbi:MAG TPA: TadE/TadG family type IV pilus assembly protein [Aquihabitans sp.]|jgi:Flp pilus assembly protein TadG|nr:TadE/TadG family type IV pilus assembly protein [Aquihabitans sp.]